MIRGRPTSVPYTSNISFPLFSKLISTDVGEVRKPFTVSQFSHGSRVPSLESFHGSPVPVTVRGPRVTTSPSPVSGRRAHRTRCPFQDPRNTSRGSSSTHWCPVHSGSPTVPESLPSVLGSGAPGITVHLSNHGLRVFRDPSGRYLLVKMNVPWTM